MKKNIINLCPFSHCSVIKLKTQKKLIAMESMRVRVTGSLAEIKEKDPAIIREWDLAIAKENAKESQLK